MLFTSYRFIGFLALLFLIYYLIPRRFQWLLLLAANALFYACAGWHGLVFISATILVSWLAGLLMGRSFAHQKSFLKSPEGKELPKEERKVWKKKERTVK